ncbi:nucleotide sugar dehydrogenase [Flavobacteriaceae bacterium]|nr:nucleotide sugar dehydrogenase [Flavobacteriaceae bacterium]
MKIKNICCIGAGYVGGPTMAVIALKCPEINITVVDSNSDRIKAWNGPLASLPIYEPGLSDVVKETRGRNLFFSEDIAGNIEKAEMIFMAVNTPTKIKGKGAGMASDLRYVEACSRDIAKYSKNDKIVIEKSTLPVRTAEKIKEILCSENNNVKFEILSNPEFLAEGSAIQDLFKSDRVLIGGDATESGQKAVQSLVDIYLNWIPNNKIITTNVWSSELSKLASNAMLAQRISSINSLSALCEKTGADTIEVSRAVGMDHRIGSYFLSPSPGFGGSCFQKDILNLVYLCEYYGLKEVAEYWHQVIKINNYQRDRIVEVVEKATNYDPSKTISILGWAFKKNTNDSRESSSIYISYKLLDKGYKIKIYDPKVKEERVFEDLRSLLNSKNDTRDLISKAEFCDSMINSINNSDVLLILTEWDEFREINSSKKIIDTRNLNIKNPYFKI